MKGEVIEEIFRSTDPYIKRELEISQREYKERWTKVQSLMKDKGYDLAYACGSELDRSDTAWLAGIFDPIIERYGILVPKEGTPVVIAGSEGGHVIKECIKVSAAEVALLMEYQISDEDYRYTKFEKLEDIVNRMVPTKQGEPIKVVIFSDGQFIPYDHVNLFQDRFGGENVIFDVDLLKRIKYEKSSTELKIMELANKIADAAFLGMLSVLRPGIRELDVAATGDYMMKRLGARRTGFPTIVSSGTRGRSVLGPATNRTIKKGEFVSLGISPTFNGYHGIMRRTVKVGEDWTGKEKAFMNSLEGLYHTVMKAVQEAAEKDLPSNIIDKKGKEYIERTKLITKYGNTLSPREPYTFIHNTGCSECQEGYGAVTPHTDEPLGKDVALMIDVAFMGFEKKGDLIFPVEYAVIEDAFWKKGIKTGVYNKMPLNVQEFAGKDITAIPDNKINLYYKSLEEGK